MSESECSFFSSNYYSSWTSRKHRMTGIVSKKGFHPPILYVRGFPFPGYPFYSKQKIEFALDYVPRKGDTFLVTYPKSGTTWMTYILWEILNRGAPLPSMEEMNYKLIPYTEMCGAAAFDVLPDPKIFKYHSNYNLVPKSPEAKYIYLYRNPKDTLVSRFFFTRELSGQEVELSEYFELFLSGSLAHGSWFEHLSPWYEHRLEPNVLFLSYEELSENRRDTLFKVARFLGRQYEECLSNDSALVEAILRQTSFHYMKAHLPVVVPAEDDSGEAQGNFRRINFFRKGTVGDWKNHLSSEQSERINYLIKSKFSDTELLHQFIL